MEQELYFTAKGLTIGYHGVPLIRDITFSLRRGEILSLIGPNGAGKTTLLRSIIRQLAPLGGVVTLDGQDMAALSGKELSTRMAVVLTERVKTELMTCEDVVATGRYPYTGKFGLLGENDWAAVREAMELVHITELAKRDFSQISDGQKQRVMLARAVCQQPELLILDEPTSFLDLRYKLEFLTILQQMSRSRHLTVILSLHELDLAGRISDKIACIKGDHIDRFGPPEEIYGAGYLSSLYDITVGSYDPRSGDVELEPVKGAPRVFVLAGNGTGTRVFRRLQRAGIPFATGILWENDLDYPAARALAAEVVSVKAFCRIGEDTMGRAKRLIDSCKIVLCTLDLTGAGELSEELRALQDYAQSWDQVFFEEIPTDLLDRLTAGSELEGRS